ncbi:unnamed protein product [Scytosiphon promiscuus]
MRLVAFLVQLLSSLRIFLAAGATAFAIRGARPPPSAPGSGRSAVSATRTDETGAIEPGGGRNHHLSPKNSLAPAGMATKLSGDEAVGGGGGHPAPSHLVVLSHGLVGTPEDLTYVKQSLERAAERAGGPGILVHSARCNAGKTKDGVVKGGTRLAREIEELVRSTPSLSRISLVGNSLGGLYVRYAAKLLYRAGDGADDVRRYTYVPLPSPLHSFAGVFAGKTGHDLFLAREKGEGGGSSSSGEATSGAGGEPAAGQTTVADGRDSSLLYEMATSEEFLRPLKAFRWRRAYANRRGDFLVPFGTAAFLEPGEGDGSSHDLFRGALAAAEDGKAETAEGASAGAAGTREGSASGSGSAPPTSAAGASELTTPLGSDAFTVMDRLLGARQGAIVGMSRIPPAENDPAATAAASGPAPGEQKESRVGAESSRREVRTKRSMEAEMAAGLNSCGWEKVAVDFGGLVPFSHNKICALSRSRTTTALFACGRSVVDHAANFLVQHDHKFFGGGDDCSAGHDDGDGDGGSD